MYANCDYPGCALPINQRCSKCGYSYCVRHVTWVPVVYVDGYPAGGGYWCCDTCGNAMVSRKYNQVSVGWRIILGAIGLGIFGCVLAQVVPLAGLAATLIVIAVFTFVYGVTQIIGGRYPD